MKGKVDMPSLPSHDPLRATPRRPHARTLYLPVLLLLGVLLSGCDLLEELGRYPRLDGIWGGIMSYQGSDVLVYALDLSTSSSGSVSGYGVVVDPLRGSRLDVTVSGTTGGGAVNLRLRDWRNDVVTMGGSVDGGVIRGTWSYPPYGMTGSFRMAAQENIGLLAGDLGGAVLSDPPIAVAGRGGPTLSDLLRAVSDPVP